MRRTVRILITATAWWAAGGMIVLLLAAGRDLVPDEPLPFSRKIDLSKDISWMNLHLPIAVHEAVSMDEPDTGWRMNGRQLLTARIGEERATFELWRTLGDGTIERDRAETTIVVERVRRGWPILCIEGATWVPGRHEAIQDRLVRVDSPSGRSTLVPLGIQPLPFLADAAIIALTLATLALTPRFAERIARRRRGVCPSCAHPLRGATRCPECGASLS
ncbi:MAG: hypothetical protein JNL80_13485 [Phycisphaerae bacterium]|nr:hypothetical protein [Phycisphaerae bacterium]